MSLAILLLASCAPKEPGFNSGSLESSTSYLWLYRDSFQFWIENSRGRHYNWDYNRRLSLRGKGDWEERRFSLYQNATVQLIILR